MRSYMQQKSYDLIKTGLFLIETWSRESPVLFDLKNEDGNYKCVDREVLLRNGLNRLYYGVLNSMAFHFNKEMEKGIHRWFAEQVKNQEIYQNIREYIDIHKKLLNLRKIRVWSDYNLDKSLSMVYGTKINEKTLKQHLYVVINWLCSQKIIPSLLKVEQN